MDVIQCGVCYGSVAMKGRGVEGRLMRLKKYRRGKKGVGWGMLISAVNALTCNIITLVIA